MSLFLSRTARQRLGLGGAFGVSGRVGLPTFYQARVLAMELAAGLGAALDEGLGAQRGADSARMTRAMTPGRLNAVSELERLFRALALELLSLTDTDRLRGLFRVLIERFGSAPVERLLIQFAKEFMPFELEPGWILRLDGAEGDTVLRQAGEVLRELLVFAWVHRIPDAEGVQRILHAGPVLEDPIFEEVAEAVEDWVDTPATPTSTRPIERLVRLEEQSGLRQQVERALELWPEAAAEEPPTLVAAVDLIEEEERPRFAPGGEPPPVEVPVYSHLEDTPARFSADEPWMAGVVIVAKNTFVWLDQLGRRRGRRMRRIDEIPDSALEELARDGADTLWLIGVWERSPASERIKRLCGNEEAVASAYSLRAYRVAEDLGGETALLALERRARRYGIRLAADMVPNHLGIDSDWIHDHPERFLQLRVPPYPTYTFGGPDLSDRDGVEIRIEDHYYDRSDAAVVFERRNVRTGRVRYVYHGNDGTTTPWNDTAQLDYSRAVVREAVIREILAAAKHFPVLRFDAAMTLAKKHVQRLWFPLPGEAGAIPSRAEHAIRQEVFDSVMPEEFWREVVARVVAERPGTMILAEAFWLMESYFVRALSVHRVYNSAFMNLLRDGRDRKYRDLLKETLRFDARILQRYVNFMTNPDEPSARQQFGVGERYFGVATLLATLPGTPLLGHGQTEALGEKYGMEFRKPLLDEPIAAGFVAEHRRRIAPLLEDRRLFAGSRQFHLYDFQAADGSVHDAVYAYSNRDRERAAIVLFNHGPRPVEGAISVSVPARPEGSGEARAVPLGRALGLTLSAGDYWLFRDAVSGRSYLCSARSLEALGLEARLAPFEARVLVEFRNVGPDRDGSLAATAAGAGRWGGDAVEATVLRPRATAAAELLRGLLRSSRLRALLEGPASGEAGERGRARAVEGWDQELQALRVELVRVGFLGPSGRGAPAPPPTSLLGGVRDLGPSFAALPWPASPRLEGARDRWLARLSAERLALIIAHWLLREVAKWGAGAARFLSLVDAGRALDALRPEAASSPYPDATWLVPSPPPALDELATLAASASAGDRGGSELIWWRIACAASAWLLRGRGAESDAAARRRWAGERPEDVVIGWVDALERLRENG